MPYSRKTRGKPARFPFRKKKRCDWNERFCLHRLTILRLMFRISNTWYLLFSYILYWILFFRAFFRSWKRSILKSCSNKWNKDWFAWYFPLEKKYPTRIKEKMKDAKLYLLSPFLRDHELNTANHRWIRSCFSSNVPAFIYILPFSCFLSFSIRISLTTFSRHRGALSRRQKEESETRQFIRNSLH